MSAESDSWCTPESLASLLGDFDLDPCSNARSHIRAARRYTVNDDGLRSVWLPGWSVFVNFPYSNPLPWCERLRDHRGPWVALAKLDPTTRWWAALMTASPVVAPFRKRVKFELSGKRSLTAKFSSVLVYRDWAPSAGLAELLWMPSAGQVERAA